MKRSVNRIAYILIVAAALAQSTIVFGQQRPVELPQIVLTAKHSEIVTPPGSEGSRDMIIIKIQSSNPSVATAERYAANQIQIVAVAPGKTTVEFYNNLTRRQYHQPVWVQAANATGGGGAGFDKTRTQLTQIVMLPRRTENVNAPGSAPHQLSSVTSSNPSVATARTNTRNTIQIYSVALGDTWVNFTDNASGKQYQVHVWVVNDLKFKPPAQPGSEPNTYAVPDLKNPQPITAVPGARIDPCLIGTWVSEPFFTNDQTGQRVGAGILLTIERTAIATIDYSGMAPVVHSPETTDSWTGKLVANINSVDKRIYGGKRNNSVILRRTNPGNRSQQGQDSTGGPASFILGSSYTCSQDILEVKSLYSNSESMTLRRQ